MNESKLAEAEKRMQYAEYLLRTPDENFSAGAIKHIVAAASYAVQALTDINDNSAGSPRLIQQTLGKFEEDEVKSFSKFYMNMWQLAGSENLSKESANNAFTKTRNFIAWLKKRGDNLYTVKKEPKKLRFVDI